MYSRIYTRLPWFFDYIGEPEEDEILFGDVNFDGTINIQDVILGVSFVLGNLIPTDEEYIATDMNQDSILNILDIIEIVNIVLGSNDLARTVKWLDKNFPELQTKERLEKLTFAAEVAGGLGSLARSGIKRFARNTDKVNPELDDAINEYMRD